MVVEEKIRYRHPGKRAGVTCQRCDRPICPACMQSAPVGFHCPECAKQGRQKVIKGPAAFGVTRPIVTQVLVGINAAVFLAGLSQTGGSFLAGDAGFADSYGLFAGGVADGEWYRLVTAGFLHAGLAHIGFNMFALWVLGSQLEPVLGRLRFGVVYGASLLAGSLGVVILSPDQLTVGASGAIFGLFGVAVALQRSRKIDIWQSGLGGILLINFAFTFAVPGISIGGHIGGFLGGLLCGFVLYELGPRLTNKALPTLLCAAAIGVASFVAAMAVAVSVS